MKISSTSPLKKSVTPSKVKGGGVSSADFESELEKAAPSPVKESFQVSNVEAIWAQQEVNVEAEKRKRQMKRGHRIIDHLEQIKQSLLSNTLSLQQLKKLQEEIRREKENVEDPILADLLSDIELRAAVELAKYL